jgi:hypothetical protein
MDVNPLFNANLSDGDNSSASSISGESFTGPAPTVTTPPVAVLQTVNIRAHVPVELSITDSNYTEWRCFFDAFVGKFGLSSHLSSPPTPDDRRDSDWIIRDQCLLSCIYNSISKDVRAIVRAPKATAYTVWNAIHDQFRDNELHQCCLPPSRVPESSSR